MKILRASANNKKKCFIVETRKGVYEYPFSRLRKRPTATDGLVDVSIDQDAGREAISYRLLSGKMDTLHIDEVLHFNEDRGYLREQLLYDLTIKAQELLKNDQIPKRELARQLKTSPIQLYRLLDQTYYGKTIDQMIRLLNALNCHVELKVKKAA